MPQPNIQVAQTQFWSFSVQRAVARNTVVEVSYSGAKGSHLYDLNNINQAGAGQLYLGDPLVTGPACANSGYVNEDTGVPTCLTRPNQQYAAINMRGSFASSSYNALNLKFQTQDFQHTGLSLITNYTWSHSLDDLSSTFGSDSQGGSGYIGSLGYTDLTNPGLDWGSSDFNVGNRVVVSPSGKHLGSRPKRALLAGRRGAGRFPPSSPLARALRSPYSTIAMSKSDTPSHA